MIIIPYQNLPQASSQHCAPSKLLLCCFLFIFGLVLFSFPAGLVERLRGKRPEHFRSLEEEKDAPGFLRWA